MSLCGNGLTQSPIIMTLKQRAFENIAGKGQNAGNQHFLLFPTMFSTLPKTNLNFSFTFLSSANTFHLDQSKIVLFGKDLNDLTEQVDL